jgi:hypothetical protein
MTRACSFFCPLAVALLLGANALAEGSSTTPSDKMASGLEAYEKGQYEAAAQLLRDDLKSNPWPTSAYYAGQSLEHLGKLVQAAELYQQALDLVPPAGTAEYDQIQKRAQEDARQRLAEIKERIPRLTLRLEGASSERVTVTVDGTSVPTSSLDEPLRLNPGSHQVVGRCGEEVVEPPAVKLAEKQQDELVLRFQCERPTPAAAPAPTSTSTPKAAPVAPPPPEQGSGASTGRTLGWVAVGVGSAGVALWGVTGVMGWLKLRTLKDEGCDQNSHCYPSQEDGVGKYKLLRTLSTAGFYVGVPLLAVGVGTLVLTHRSQQSDAGAVTAWVGPGSAGISGRFQ